MASDLTWSEFSFLNAVAMAAARKTTQRALPIHGVFGMALIFIIKLIHY